MIQPQILEKLIISCQIMHCKHEQFLSKDKYCTARKFDGEFNLAVGWLGLIPQNKNQTIISER